MSQDTFTTLIGNTITRIAPDGTISRIPVHNYQTAKYLYDLQDHGFKYITIHSKKTECESCHA